MPKDTQKGTSNPPDQTPYLPAGNNGARLVTAGLAIGAIMIGAYVTKKLNDK